MELKKIKIISKDYIEVEMSEFETIEIKSYNDQTTFQINGIDRDFSDEQKSEILQYIETNINKNEMRHQIFLYEYEKIFEKFSIENICAGYHNDREKIQNKLDSMISYFQDQEDYEKCKVLNNLMIQFSRM